MANNESEAVAQEAVASTSSSPTTSVCEIKIESVVKGYHHFRIRPHTDIPLKLVAEENNEHDIHAVGVWMPHLCDIPQQFHNDITRKERGKQPAQKVLDIAGRQVGRVPANLCRMFRELLDNGTASKIMCHYTDDVGLSVKPSHHEKFQKGTKRLQDRPGGGAVLHCIYQVTVKNEKDVLSTREKLENIVANMGTEGTLL
ncbi:uncharacterized protein [Ptychodera flava]|uniref:uncharacterized protein n=1 Tax=Ptychodera flava TaxID=63121 RepID=UPI00396A01E2